MKYFYILIFLVLFNSFSAQAEDSLTIKQQLDRIMEEVKDLNKAVFNKSFEKDQIYTSDTDNDIDRFSSIDIRIYDLEKDIKNLTLQFEEILFKIEDLTNDMSSLKSELISKIENIEINPELNNVDENQPSVSSNSSIKEENTLGKIVISDNSKESDESISEDIIEEKNAQEEEINKLSPEEKLQFALDQMMKKNYDKSKNILEKFIVTHANNSLSGSAHFWLGKIYLFESNYRKAAIVFGEGVQKFPKSIKAAEMYYELTKSLYQMNKTNEACKTLSLLEQNYKESKFTKDPEKIKDNLNCPVSN